MNDRICYDRNQWWIQNQQTVDTRHEGPVSDHKEIFLRDTHNLDELDP